MPKASFVVIFIATYKIIANIKEKRPVNLLLNIIFVNNAEIDLKIYKIAFSTVA